MLFLPATYLQLQHECNVCKYIDCRGRKYDQMLTHGNFRKIHVLGYHPRNRWMRMPYCNINDGIFLIFLNNYSWTPSLTNPRFDEPSVWRTLGLTNPRFDEPSVWRTLGLTNPRFDEPSVWRTLGLTNPRFDEPSVWRTLGLTNPRFDEPSVWRTLGLTNPRFDEPSVWRTLGLTIPICDSRQGSLNLDLTVFYLLHKHSLSLRCTLDQ